MNEHAPPALLLASSERLFLEVTEPLDQLIALKLAGIVRQLVSVAYSMGHADGGQAPQPCTACPAKGGSDAQD
ncbi:hypothetical protein [Gloeobacter kilaueensis]|uniref:Uncharacterized protein n=1 Tax=Gloeobacter kilaueensis (strain ATCC BAA-2537 / CCAP 1431/1 / ULC 316 / JS1) TaxID=1183438 RepID=U5QE19_GLOK1|nr:hypothetical protein [Gloeobacter kilaueensis]AGY57118.1 hypothetical protein GKIL_0872 [Gloeobacter kilaueensis JS1]